MIQSRFNRSRRLLNSWLYSIVYYIRVKYFNLNSVSAVTLWMIKKYHRLKTKILRETFL